jgi:GNAT superfamily N-acetyltransferase
MEVLRFDEPRSFLERAMPLLAPDADAEARHNLMLGIATVMEHPTSRSTGCGLTRQAPSGGNAHAAVQRGVRGPLTASALDAVVDAVAEDDRRQPGSWATPHVHRAAERWPREPARPRWSSSAEVYSLVNVEPVPTASGAAREATPDDRDLLLGWIYAFAEEATGGPPGEPGLLERMLDARLEADDVGYWLWEDDGEPVSATGYGSPTVGGIRIGPVYTPPGHRRRGYATILVAELSRWLLGRGHRACYLYTDLANPISNSIYGKIGYRRVCDSADVRFT